jgi:hypothetical protein
MDEHRNARHVAGEHGDRNRQQQGDDKPSRSIPAAIVGSDIDI